MIAFIVAFALFAASSLSVALNIVKQEIISSSRKNQSADRWKATYIIYSACYFFSQAILVFLFFRINSQCKDMNSCVNESKVSQENSQLVDFGEEDLNEAANIIRKSLGEISKNSN